MDRIRNIKIPHILSTFLAEDIGMQIGDGGVYIYKESNGDTHYRVECYGNLTEDRLYLERWVKPLKEKLFNLNLSVKSRNSINTCYIRVNSKAIVYFYHKIFKLPIGKKCERASIPQILLDAPKEVLLSCIRGIADTDFSLSFKAKAKRIHYYPVLHLGTRSKILVQQLHQILGDLGISSEYTIEDEYYDRRTRKVYIKHNLYISGKKNLEKWIKMINFRNPVHLTKYLIWKKFGFCPPKTTLSQRLKILNGSIDPLEFEDKF